MAGGRPPKPTALHIVQGTRSEVKVAAGHVSPEPDPVMELPKPPHTLTTDLAQRTWIETGGHLLKSKVLKVTDLHSLESYCIAYQMMCSASEEVQQDGITILGASGVMVKNPAVNVLKDAQTELRSMGTLLGLNPSARTRINVADKEKEKPEGLGSLSKPRRG